MPDWQRGKRELQKQKGREKTAEISGTNEGTMSFTSSQKLSVVILECTASFTLKPREFLNYKLQKNKQGVVKRGIIVCKYLKFYWKNLIERWPEGKKECECSGRTVGKKYFLLGMFVESLKNKKWIREKQCWNHCQKFTYIHESIQT